MNRDLAKIRPPQVAAAASVIATLRPDADVSSALDLIVSRLREVTGADGVVVELQQEDALVCCYASGLTRRWLGRKRPQAGSLGGECFVRDEALLTASVHTDRRFTESAASEPEVRSMISVPLHLTGPSVGVVRILSGAEGFFSGDDLVVARLVTASIRRVLMHELREEPQTLHSDKVVAALWSLRDRRRSQKRLAGDPGYEVSMVVCKISGYLTSQILGHLSLLVRSSDHCIQEDAGTYAIVMPGTTSEEAMIAAARIRRELEAFAAAAEDDIKVSCEVRTLLSAPEARTA